MGEAPLLTDGLAAQIAAEVDDLAGARVHAVHEDGLRRLRIVFDVEGEGRRDLVVLLTRGAPCFFLAPPKKAPRQPSALAGRLRKFVQGARLRGARHVPGERVLGLLLERGGETSEVWIEAFGQQPNLYLVGPDGLVAATVDGKVATRRGASVGLAFEPVPPREVRHPAEALAPGESASERFRARVAAHRRATKEEGITTRWLRTARREGKRAEAALKELEGDLAREGEAVEVERRGELLRASFHLLKPGQEKVVVPDYSVDPPTEVVLELDPRKTPGEQVAACFDRAAGLRARVEHARAREEEVRERAAGWRAALDWLQRLEGEDDKDASPDGEALEQFPPAVAESLREAAQAKAAPPSGRKGPRRALPYHTFRSLDGWRILVGRSARQSDELTLKVAKPHDLFLHVRAVEGSHVIVPTPRGKSVPKETLLDAAELACVHSKRAKADHNEVDYVERRYVRKPRGAAAGFVLFERERTLSLRADAARRTRLAASREQPT